MHVKVQNKCAKSLPAKEGLSAKKAEKALLLICTPTLMPLQICECNATAKVLCEAKSCIQETQATQSVWPHSVLLASLHGQHCSE